MAGKYDHITPGLPWKQPDDVKYQQRVDDEKPKIREELGEVSAPSLTERYAALREQKDAIEETLSACNLQLEAVTQMIFDQYEADEISSVKRSDGGSVTVGTEPYARVVDPVALWDWGMEQENIARSFTLNWQTLNSLVKELLLKRLPEPPGVEAVSRKKITFRRGKGSTV